jgi:hypothetical protein
MDADHDLALTFVLVVSDFRGATNTYVLLTLEGKFFGGSPVVHLYLNTDPTTPFLSSRVDGTRDHTLGKGAQYINGTGEQFLCGPVVDDRSIECAYFYGEQVSVGGAFSYGDETVSVIMKIACCGRRVGRPWMASWT